MSEDPPSDPLAGLGEKINAAQRERVRQQAPRSGKSAPTGIGLGMRMATDMAAALIVGLAIGLLALRFLPAPWGVVGLIVFFFLGAAAGMVNVFRAAMGIGYDRAPPGTRNRNGSRPD